MTAADILLWVGMGGCGGEAMMGVRRVVKKGWGEALIEVLNKTGIVTLSLVIGMHITGRNRLKSQFQGGFPIFGRESPRYDIIISQKCHVLAPKKSENEMCKRFHLIIYARWSSHLENLKNWLTSNF